ncbi:hypothetical protein C0Q70_08824 [Pomacea canaliculata]|uniref:Kazal-like domain-containing protein n=1 Tax=Pomacea canaliculata TaxID=400727 RepID=A0A2T7P820_POMCA|nr:hypothetical protein C0Q70_08824 [Pomacea canaliculata]
MVCRSTSLSSTSRNTRAPLRVVTQHCGGPSGMVTECMQSQAQPARTTNPVDNLPCCERAKTQSCRDKCRDALQSTMSEDDIIDVLIVACGGPDLMEPLWQCFLQTHTSPANHTPPATSLDNAKLHCCAKAVTTRCRDLCTQTYKDGWSYHNEFHKSCSYIQPVSMMEASMHKCLMDVDEPCQLGCSGLSYCTNFNHRPTELFQSCTREADYAAEKAFKMWESGPIILPQMEIHVKDIRTCEPEKWKAIACATQIKPCHKQLSLLSLCKEDCIDILNKCVDAQQSVPQLCNALHSARTPGACIPLAHYLQPSPHIHEEGEVTHPCNPHPCQADEVCEVRRRKCKHTDNCQQFICKSACTLGKVSSMRVPAGAYVRIPNTAGQAGDDCFLGCRCSSKGVLEHCKPLPCLQRRNCVLGPANTQEHGAHFLLDDSQCMCHDGDLICSRQSCLTDTTGHITGSPNSCPVQYKPVCGANGKTYPNSCMARCAGVTQFISTTSCADYDPCKSNPCRSGERCIAHQQVCLGHITEQGCPQYECIADEGLCNPHHHDPVCDTTGEEFSNACVLYSHHRVLAYRGHCQPSCSLQSGSVCGHDGETYSSECAALAAGTTIDYAENLMNKFLCDCSGSSQTTPFCHRISCPPLSPPHCRGIRPPGACCSICAAQLRVLYDPRLVDMAAQRMEQGPVTVQQLVRSLSRLLMVVQCDVFGYLSLEGDLVLIVLPLASQPSDIQIEACNSEAERLDGLISNQSPTLVAYLELSPLLLAPAQAVGLHYVGSMYNMGSAASSPMSSLCLLLAAIFLATTALTFSELSDCAPEMLALV